MLNISKQQALSIFTFIESKGPHSHFDELHIYDSLWATIKYIDNVLYICIECEDGQEIDIEGLGCEICLNDLN